MTTTALRIRGFELGFDLVLATVATGCALSMFLIAELVVLFSALYPVAYFGSALLVVCVLALALPVIRPVGLLAAAAVAAGVFWIAFGDPPLRAFETRYGHVRVGMPQARVDEILGSYLQGAGSDYRVYCVNALPGDTSCRTVSFRDGRAEQLAYRAD